MTTQTTIVHDQEVILRRALQGNAIFSAISGGIFMVAANEITRLGGLTQPSIIFIIGVLLIGYAALLFHTTRQKPINRSTAIAAIIADLLWVIGSVLILLFGWFSLTILGQWAVFIIADIVACFMGWQLYGLWRTS